MLLTTTSHFPFCIFMPDTDGMFVNDFLILPGQWRPQCRWEHIAWISPPWPSQYYLWLDLPETVICEAGNFYLSHINLRYTPSFPDLPKVPWSITPEGISFKRELPNGVAFGVTIEKRDDITVSLRLDIHNGSDVALRNIRTQTCSYLRGLKEFSECTTANKYVRQDGLGWTEIQAGCDYHDGETALPVIATRSSESNRLAAMTWFEHTGRLWSNPAHPCMHADPCFPDLEPGDQREIEGALIFFEGTLEEFEEWFKKNGRP